MSNPTAYDERQNRWIFGLVVLWSITIITAILATAEAYSGGYRKEINELRERVARLEAAHGE